MDREQLKQDVRDGQIDPKRLVDMIIALQRQLAEAHGRIEGLEKQRSGRPPEKLDQPFSLRAEEKRRAARGKKRKKNRKPPRTRLQQCCENCKFGQYYCPFAVASALRATLEAWWRVSSQVVWEANPAQDVRPWRRQQLVRDSRLSNRISKPPGLSERFFRRSISVCWKQRRLDQSRNRGALSTIKESEELANISQR